METRRRSSLGRFVKLGGTKAPEQSTLFKLPKGWTSRILILIGILFILSPWIFVMMRNNSIVKFLVKFAEFYDQTFPSNCECPVCPVCPVLNSWNNMTAPNL